MQRIDPAPRRKALTGAAWLSALIGLSGCVIIPYPREVYEGSEITEESLRWLHAGEKTRAQVLERLGPPDIDFVDQHTIAYAWSGQFGGVHWIQIFPYGPATVHAVRMRRALMIRFDADKKVKAFSIIGRPTEIVPYDVRVVSLDEDWRIDDWRVLLAQWLKKHGPGSSQPGAAAPK